MTQKIDCVGAGGKLAIIAGGGAMPAAVADSAIAHGRDVFIVGLAEACDENISRFPHERISFGQLTHMVKVLRQQDCREIVFIGTAVRPQLRNLRIDLGGVKAIPYFFKIALGGDDKLLSGIVRYFEGHGFTVRGAHEVAPHLVANEGTLGRCKASADDLEDARLGQRVIRALGRFDIGQGVVVAKRRILAIEAAEGTDAMLDRCREIRKLSGGASKRRSGVLVKFPKPEQDIRVDMPTIGAETVRRAAGAGLRGITIASAGVLVAEREETISAADTSGLFVVGLPWLNADD